ncbi:lytic murein transglycosylase [Nocardia sp. NPDC005366]|uniref:lytic transglycosylase domain-containing protein n=1 Tax=Nocardia sp. NPDC005366 TaxID=3156878 RepID=UPI0033A58B08
MRLSAPITVSALIAVGVVVSGSVPATGVSAARDTADPAPAASESTAREPSPDSAVGLLSVVPDSPRRLHAVTPGAAEVVPAGATVPLREISLPENVGALGIPEIALAAYRNAELAMESSRPGCGLTWHLLAGIGRIESGHASGGRTDAAGTTVQPIFGPALDGTLPANEVIPAAGGGYVRALGPMQFLPDTWNRYAADGNGDGIEDPHNVFDAALGAGNYLCSGDLDLRDPAQELRAVLRYNNSMSYATDVLSWSAAYHTGGTPRRVALSPELVPPGSAPIGPGPAVLAANTPPRGRPIPLEPMARTSAPVRVTPPLVTMPGVTVECGILCAPIVPEHPEPPVERSPDPAPFHLEEQPQVSPAPPPAHQPSINLPFGIVVPLPMPQT